MDIEIRRYRKADQQGVLWLYQRTPPAGQVYARAAKAPPELEAIESLFDAFWVAIEPTRDGDAVVGITAIEEVRGRTSRLEALPIPDFVSIASATSRLHHVMVVPERQRRGLGRRLVETALDWSRSKGYQTLVLETTSDQEAAVALYRSLGFKELGRTSVNEWEIVWFGLLISGP